MSRAGCLVVLACSLSAVAAAQEPKETLAPGMWRITVQSQVPGMPIAMAPVEVDQCLSAKDAKDPSKLLGSVSSPDASNCVYSEKGYEGASFHFTMQCGGAMGLRATGHIAFTASSLNGTIDATASFNGQAVALSNAVTAQRVGDCHTPG